MTERQHSLNQKTQDALDRIIKVHSKFGNYLVIGNSGGKDSTVMLHLAQQIYPDIQVIHTFKEISEDIIPGVNPIHPETLKFLYRYVTETAKELTILSRNGQMEKWVADNGILCQLDGSRSCEFTRDDKSAIFVSDGEDISREFLVPFVEKGLFGMSFSFPIYDWSDNDVFEYHFEHDLPLSKEYLSDEGFVTWQANNPTMPVKIANY